MSSHIHTLLSLEHGARYCPLGENATPLISESWPSSTSENSQSCSSSSSSSSACRPPTSVSTPSASIRAAASSRRHIPAVLSNEPVTRQSCPGDRFGFHATYRMDRLCPFSMVEWGRKLCRL